MGNEQQAIGGPKPYLSDYIGKEIIKIGIRKGSAVITVKKDLDIVTKEVKLSDSDIE